MQNIIFRITSFLILVTFFFTFSVAPVFAARSYTYDANGNMTSDGEKCYQYNEANQLKIVRNCSNNKLIADYIYDHNGKRIVKKEYTSGVLKRTVYSPDDGFEKVKLASNSAIENTTYYMANDEVVVRKNPDGTKTYYHGDHLGSNAVLTNQSGTVVEKTTYEPYGEVKTGGTLSKFQYTGQEKDLETGLNYYDARYYDSHIHRFTQPDGFVQNIYDPQALNRYSYVRNNPLRYKDPDGHFFREIFNMVIGAAIGHYIGLVTMPKPASNPKYAIPPNVSNNNSKTNNLVSSGSTVKNNSATLTPKNPNYGPLPQTPPGVNISGNIQQAYANRFNPLYFPNKVKAGGDWDYKDKRSPVNDEDFGNVHYGVAGMASGYTRYELQVAAGFYQQWTNFKRAHDEDKETIPVDSGGTPIFIFPFGDASPNGTLFGGFSNDQNRIIQGTSIYYLY